jgi:hypothetical protein
MKPALLLVMALPVVAGCANQQLRYSALRQTSTLADIQETQVIENFARIAANPGALPFLALANSGSATVTDGGSGTLSFLGAHKLFTQSTFGLSASRSIALNWGLAPMNNPDRLRAMKAAYQFVLDPSSVDPADQAKLDAAIKADPSYAPRPGWIEIGGKWDVPKHTWRVGRCGKVYVWVMPDQADDLSRFVLLTLNLASWQSSGKSEPAEASPSAVRPITPNVSPSSGADPFPPRLFDQPPSVNPGLFFVPRAQGP